MSDAESLMWSSPTLAFIGESGEALRRAEHALALAPHNPFAFRFRHFICNAHYWAGDCEAAAHWGLKSLADNPNYTSNIRLTIASLVALGRIDEARPLVRRVVELQPDLRVVAMVQHHPCHDIKAREIYGMRLIEAGFPP